MIWDKSTMTSIYYSKDPADENFPCTVKITEQEILVEYDDEGLCQYAGHNDGTGHYHLNLRDGDGRATLHQFPGSRLLEGSWIEDGARGMWRIEIGSSTEDSGVETDGDSHSRSFRVT